MRKFNNLKYKNYLKKTKTGKLLFFLIKYINLIKIISI